MNTVSFGGQQIGVAVAMNRTPHRCGKNDLKPLLTVAGIRGMQCAVCKDVWRIEHRNNRVMNIYRNGARQEA